MKIAYVAGPYRDPRGNFYIYRNIQRARDLAVELSKLGIGFICPHLNTSFMGGTLIESPKYQGCVDPEAFWLDLGLELLKRCDILVLNAQFDYERSKGTLAEIEYAKALSLPLYEWPRDYKKLEGIGKI